MHALEDTSLAEVRAHVALGDPLRAPFFSIDQGDYFQRSVARLS